MDKDVMMTAQSSTWPTSPYRGLEQYGPEEAVLFAGRERDVDACANLLAATSTRILLLHGSTGTGKSSLLRAALIPMLGSAESNFQFLSEGTGPSSPALFIRSTDAPLSALAGAIYEFASRELSIQTPRGRRTIDLSPALLGCASIDAFRARVGADHRLVLESLQKIGAHLPRTLVLIVDQGEEVLTLTPGPEGQTARDEFFRFIATFSRADLDLKLLVALRTEYYGRFRHEFQKRFPEVARISDYYLGDLDPDGLLAAIVRPTEREPIDGLGSPFDHYRFDFDPGLPEQIVADLTGATPAGGVLPALQIVCSRLYEQAVRTTRHGSPARITAADYAALGGIEGQINDYIDAELGQACRELGADSNRLLTERGAWKQVLSTLARPQIDGTVTTDMKQSADLEEIARKLRCKLPFDSMMNMLCSEGRRLCRRVEVIRRAASASRIGTSARSSEFGMEKVVCFTLAHEALGPPLLKWGGRAEQLSAEIMVATALFSNGVRLSEETRHEDAMKVYDEVVRRYGDRPEVELGQRVAYALLNKGWHLGELGRSEDAVAVYDDVVRRFGERAEVLLAEQVAKALFNKGVCLGELRRNEDAVVVYDDLVRRFGERAEVALAEQVAKALFNKGVCLGELRRNEDAVAVAVYDDLVRRFGERAEVALAEQVARALFNKGVCLGKLSRNEDAVAVYDDLVRRFGERAEVALAEQVAKALVNKGVYFGESGRNEDAVVVYDDVVRRFGERAEGPLAEQVAKALFNTGVRLGALGRGEEELTVYDDLVRRFGDRAEGPLAERVAQALVNKSVRLGALGRGEEELAVYDDVVRRFGERADGPLAEPVARALLRKGVRLGALGRGEEELTVYDDVVRRFGDRAEGPLAERVAQALVNKSVRLGALGRGKEELAVYDDVVRRFGERADGPLAGYVATALVNKGVRLGQSGRSEEELAVYDDVVRRFGDRAEGPLDEPVASALNGLGFALLCRAKRRWLDGHEDEARRMLTNADEKINLARTRQPENPFILGNAGYIAFVLDRKEEARALLAESIRLGGAELREAELKDADIHSLPQDEEFRALVRSL